MNPRLHFKMKYNKFETPQKQIDREELKKLNNKAKLTIGDRLSRVQEEQLNGLDLMPQNTSLSTTTEAKTEAINKFNRQEVQRKM